jgi:hypothetical protein
VDWYRTICIHLVVIVHSIVNTLDATGGEARVGLGDPEVKASLLQKKDGFIRCLVQIGIPSFFYLSGNAMTFFKTQEKGFFKYLWGKMTSLIFPLCLAIPILLIPRLYIGQEWEAFARPDGVHAEEDIGAFYLKTLPSVIVKLSWLWFLLGLFLNCMVLYPLLAWTQRRKAKMPFGNDDIALIIGQTLSFGSISYLGYVLAGPIYGPTQFLPSCIIVATYFAVQYSVLFLNISDKNALHLKWIGPIAAVLLNIYRLNDTGNSLYNFVSMLNYDYLFMAQGVVDQIYLQDQLKHRGTLSETLMVPFALLMFYITYAFATPSN